VTYAARCITIVLNDFPDCTWPAERGEVCEACYHRIENAIIRADQLRIALAGVERAITPEPGSTIAGPRLPLTALDIAFDEIRSYRPHPIEAASWVTTGSGAEQAVRFARAVHRADQAYPIVAAVRKLERVRCPACARLTAVVSPPDWYGDAITVECMHCKWKATNPDAIDIVAEIEHRGRLDDAGLIMLELRARRQAERIAREARAAAKRAEQEGAA
jgi:hypothetical protein